MIEKDGAATDDLNPDCTSGHDMSCHCCRLLLALRLPMSQALLYSRTVGLIPSFLMSLSDATSLRLLFVPACHSSLASSSASASSPSSLAMVAFVNHRIGS
eukprot:CAMPEP_0198108022 /NCGR_PEP_ID=MMETSP1442-20131203/113_1 /TAXON_ID= /ORGANISM="Craspedostauros australis, Strain CCMP3328" /LENGTH=100 /DNA_ID=CAMNT_0043763209 /DNA_START=99 /DNA_END=398 /DNA_ORIENTATION=+